MGTCMAPSYANIFMGKLEYDLLQWTSQKKTTIWWRYIVLLKRIVHFANRIVVSLTIEYSNNWSIWAQYNNNYYITM